MIRYNTLCALLLTSLFFVGCPGTRPIKAPPSQDQMVEMFKSSVASNALPLGLPHRAAIDSFTVDSLQQKVRVVFNKDFVSAPLRPLFLQSLQTVVDTFFQGYFQGFKFFLWGEGLPLEAYVPNYFRGSLLPLDSTRLPKPSPARPPALVRKRKPLSRPSYGLTDRNVVVWHSHGWYYDVHEGRWEWQRPRLFQTVEDLIPMSFTIPYLIPMLENAGAQVFLPRERDTQIHEMIVDNDSPSRSYVEQAKRKRYAWITGDRPGFAVGTPPYASGINPFQGGTFRFTSSDSIPTAGVTWTPNIPETGEYAVYISFASSEFNITDAHYTVHHAGGSTEFLVNQQIGGGTWIYLGTFRFLKGHHRDRQSVVLTNESSSPGAVVSADAVRFGGGMGLIERGGRTSGRPKFVEAGRYYLQYAGMPDTLVYSFNHDRNDYNDDYVSRGEFVNYLFGAPFGPNQDRMATGLGIPIDISLAFHTDAGITQDDSTIGTLAIYSTTGFDTAAVFPDSVSRMANRDLADLVQTQVVDDMRRLFDPRWTRRHLRDSRYSEATRPNVPSLLLELLSHQNFADMKFTLDPQFRFHASRAIYKGILRFITSRHSLPAVVQPLPISHFRAELEGGSVRLNWKPAIDPLEPSATPRGYIVYTRVNDSGFDGGVLTDTAGVVFDNIQAGVIYSYKVAAVNDGGESFPSEILSVCSIRGGDRPALVINAFDRTSGPAPMDIATARGFLSQQDNGVPDRVDYGFTGMQFDFSPSSPYRTNDAPGHGSSFADYEAQIIAGNSFDYPYVHGASLRANRYSFVSCSDEAVIDSLVDLRLYRFVDLILGEEKTTLRNTTALDSALGPQFEPFPSPLQTMLFRYCDGGGKLFVSGSYVLSDLFEKRDSAGAAFASTVLKAGHVTTHASRTGIVFSVDSSFLNGSFPLQFCTNLNDSIYAVESPGALQPLGGSKVLLRYRENEFAAAVGFRNKFGVIVCGFPFETILGQKSRDVFMGSVLRYLRP